MRNVYWNNVANGRCTSWKGLSGAEGLGRRDGRLPLSAHLLILPRPISPGNPKNLNANRPEHRFNTTAAIATAGFPGLTSDRHTGERQTHHKLARWDSLEPSEEESGGKVL